MDKVAPLASNAPTSSVTSKPQL